MKHPVIGFAMCGSFCTFAPVLEALEELHTVFPDIIPIMSDTSYETESRFGDASSVRERLEAIPGAVPHPLDLPKGCKFAPRCKYATEQCAKECPSLKDRGNGHQVACWNK